MVGLIGLYICAGLVFALMNLIEDRHTGGEWFGDMEGRVACIILWVTIWPPILIGYIAYKITKL